VRELAHVLEAAVILSAGSTISEEHLDPMLTELATDRSSADRSEPAESVHATSVHVHPSDEPRRYSFFGSEEDEREAIRAALVRCRGNRTRAAIELGMARNTLAEKLRRHGLNP
jgi:DNA-binding NtrC family response regulator